MVLRTDSEITVVLKTPPTHSLHSAVRTFCTLHRSVFASHVVPPYVSLRHREPTVLGDRFGYDDSSALASTQRVASKIRLLVSSSGFDRQPE